MMKRTLSILLCLVMVLSFAAPAVQASGNGNGYTSDNIMDNIVIEDGSNVDVVIDGETVNTSQNVKLPNPSDWVTYTDEPVQKIPEVTAPEMVCSCQDLASAVEHPGICEAKVAYMEACKATAEKLFAVWGSYTHQEQDFLLSYLEDAYPLKHYELEALLNAPTGSASETYADGTTVSVEGIPQDGSVSVGEAADAVKDIVDTYVAEQESELSPLFGYDVSVQNGDGDNWQPETKVKMELELPGEKLHKNTKVIVVHVDDDGNATTIEAKVTEDGKIAFETPGFSAFYGFTVDFHYEDATFSINGMSSIKLSELFAKLYMPVDVEAVADVEFSNDEYIRIEKQETDWELFSLKAFSTTEALTLTMKDGQVYDIAVTDAQAAKIFVAKNSAGTTIDYNKNWDTDGNGIVTWYANTSGGQLKDSPGWTRQGVIEVQGPGSMTIRFASGNTSADTLYVDLLQFKITGGANVKFDFDNTFSSTNKRVVIRSSASNTNVSNGAYKGYAMIWVVDGSLSIEGHSSLSPHMEFVFGGNDGYWYSARETIENTPVYDRHALIILGAQATSLSVKYAEFMHTASGAIAAYKDEPPTSVNMTLENCIFYKSVQNATGRTGGAIQHYQTGNGGSFTAKNCQFKGNVNTKTRGGAIATYGEKLGSFTIQNCTFENCSAGTHGGAISLQGSVGNISITGTKTANSSGGYNYTTSFKNCSTGATDGRGGGISANCSTYGNITIENVLFSGNNAYHQAGGAYFGLVSAPSAISAGSVKITNCDFKDNTARDDAGGLCITDGQYQSIALTSCTFDHCVTTGYGGGLSMRTIYSKAPFSVVQDVKILNCTFKNCLSGKLAPNAYVHADGSADESQANIEKWSAKDNAELAGLDKLNGASGCGAMVLGGTIGGKLEVKGASEANPMLIENCLTWNNGGAIFLTNDLKVTGYKDSAGKVTEAVTLQYLNINKCFARDGGSAIYLSSTIIPLLNMDHCTIQNCGYFDQHNPDFPDHLVELQDDKWYACQDVKDLSKPKKDENGNVLTDANGKIQYDTDPVKTAEVKAAQLARWKSYTKDEIYVGTDYSGTFRTVGSTGCVAKITNCEFKNNKSYFNGGGIYWNANYDVYADQAAKEGHIFTSALTITNTYIHGNSADVFGGGIFCEGSVTIQSCEIYDNTALKRGGGIAQNVYNNTSRQLGESGANERTAMILEAAPGGQPVKIYNNTAMDGGGISITIGKTDSYPHTIKKDTPKGMESKPAYWDFATDFTYEVSFHLGGSYVYGNKATRNGGGIFYDTTYFLNETEAPEDGVSWEERQRQADSFIKNVNIDEGKIYSNTAGYGAAKNDYYDTNTYAEKVTDASTLKVGDYVIIAAKDHNYVMSTGMNTTSNDYHTRKQTALTTDSTGRLILSDATEVLTLVKGTKDGTFALRLPDGRYLRAASSNRFRLDSGVQAAGSFSISVNASTGAATMIPGGNYTANTIQYNSGSGEFSHYSQGSQSAVVLYRVQSNVVGNGGGVYVNANQVKTSADLKPNEKTGSSTVSITGGEIYKNTVYVGSGAGVYVTGVNALCTISGETTTIGARYLGKTSDGVSLSSGDGNTATNRRIALNNYIGGCGGGIAIFGGARIEMEGGYIVNNVGDTAGGGVAVHGKDSTMYLHNGYIDGNASANGGGISLNQATGNSSATDEKYRYGMYFDGGVVSNNLATRNKDKVAYGGGICISSSATMKFAGGEVSGNKAVAGSGSNSNTYKTGQEGGGIAVCQKSTMTFTGGTVLNNRAYYGGGVVVRGDSTVNMSGDLVLYSKADEEADAKKPEAERLGIKEGDVNLSESTGVIAGNVAWLFGGGVYMPTGSNRFTMSNGCINGNMAYDKATLGETYDGGGNCLGGGVLCDEDGIFTLNGGHIDDNKAYSGGGILVWKATVTINNGYMLRNGVRRSGGAIYSDYSTVNVQGGVFRNNYTDGTGASDPGNGGAIFSYGDASTASVVTISGGEFYNNTATNTGGAVSVKGATGSFTVKNGIFKENSAGTNGGAFYCSAPNAAIESGIFENNTAGYHGGAFCSEGSTVVITGGEFSKNKATSASGTGGAVAVRGDTGSFTVSNATFKENTAGLHGGAFYCNAPTAIVKSGKFEANVASYHGGAFCSEGSNVTINGGDFIGNRAKKNGGGAYFSRGAIVTISDGYFKQNTATNGGGMAIKLDTSVQISGGTFEQNTASTSGGGIHVNGATTEGPTKATTLTMNGGKLFKNSAVSNGGGVCVTGYAQVSITTAVENGKTTYGEITENIANNGGGIYVTEGADLTVIGGYITYNNATAPSGSTGLTTGYKGGTGLYGTGGGICVTKGTDTALSTFTLAAPAGTTDMAIYGNMATFSADDVFASGDFTQLTVPNVKEMNMEEYGFAPEGWFEDYNTGDTSYHQGINIVGAEEDEHSALRYRNAYGPQRKHIDPLYVVGKWEGKEVSDDKYYVNKANAYVAMTLGLPAAVDDTVVIDFAGAVDINLRENDMFLTQKDFAAGSSYLMDKIPTPDGETVIYKNFIYLSKELPKEGTFSQHLENKSTARVENGNSNTTEDKRGIVTYTPAFDSMAFPKEDTFGYLVQHENFVYYATVTVIPATILYFEDSTSYVTYHTTDADGNALAEWKSVNEVGVAGGSDNDNPNQDQDRPGFTDLEGLDSENIYGHDGNYASTATFSNDSARWTHVARYKHEDTNGDKKCDFCKKSTKHSLVDENKKDGVCDICQIPGCHGSCKDTNGDNKCDKCGNVMVHTCVDNRAPEFYCDICGRAAGTHTVAARATFTFTGTGFDIVSLCNKDTGIVMASVYKGAEPLNFDNPSQDDWENRYVASYIVETYFGYTQNEKGEWVVDTNPDPNANTSLYQVPVIKADLTKVMTVMDDPNTKDTDESEYKDWGYGTYTVELYVAPSFLEREVGYWGSDFYLDAIRIYNPAGVGEFANAVTNKGIQEAYQADNEGWPVYTELRNMFIQQKELNTEGTEGVIFIDGKNDQVTIGEYKSWGPNNEVYLNPGEAIAFTMDMDAYGQNVAGIQLGLRGLTGQGSVYAYMKTSTGSNLRFVRTSVGTTDMYYDIGKKNTSGEFQAAGKVVVVSNPWYVVQADGTPLLKDGDYVENTVPLAITNIKVTHTSKPQKATKFKLFRADTHTAEIALEILNAEQLVESPVVTPKRPALSFNGMVCYNVFFSAENLGDLTGDDLGLAVFSTEDTEGTVETAREVIYGAVEIDGLYMTATSGVHAKYLGDKQYFRAFAKKADGTFVYSRMVSYSALDYAKNVLAKSDDVKLKRLVVAMLNYGAEAQKFFGYKTDELMNASLTADDQALLSGFNADSLNSVGKVDASKVGAFASTGGFTRRSPAISFKGAFEINYFFTPANAVDGDMTLYFWNEDTYNSVTELTAENADRAVAMTLDNGSYTASSDEIAAKYLDKTLYVAAVYECDGVTYCSGVLPYSIAAYCQNPPDTVQELATAAAIYGCSAKQYFGV